MTKAKEKVQIDIYEDGDLVKTIFVDECLDANDNLMVLNYKNKVVMRMFYVTLDEEEGN